MQNPTVLWRPNPGPQTTFLASRADEALYGGAAGGGKSAALLALPLRWTHNPNFRGLYLRRESKYLGEAIDKSVALYTKLGARLVHSPKIVWTFPSGATIWFNHCEHESDVQNYDSFEFSLVLFDELTHFTERQYKGIRARLRGTDPTLPYVSRAATNPGGDGHDWAFAHWGAWLNPKHPRPAAPGERRWYLEGQDVVPGTRDAESRTFIPALLRDNPHVDPRYRAKLLQLDPVRRAQLERGDWLARASKKDFFDRARLRKFGARLAAVDVLARCRGWDFGSTADGDPSAGVLVAWLRGFGPVVEHVEWFRGAPDEVHARFARTLEADRIADPRTLTTIPLDPGAAGKFTVADFQRRYAGYEIVPVRPTGDKPTRFRPFSSRALAGNAGVVEDDSWDHAAYYDECEAFPLGGHDDRVDATSDAYAAVAARAEVGEAQPTPEPEDTSRWAGYGAPRDDDDSDAPARGF